MGQKTTVLVYRCLVCGYEDRPIAASGEDDDITFDLEDVARAILEDNFASPGVHQCSNGSIGVLQLIGAEEA